MTKSSPKPIRRNSRRTGPVNKRPLKLADSLFFPSIPVPTSIVEKPTKKSTKSGSIIDSMH